VPAKPGDDVLAEDATRSGSAVVNLKLNEVKKIYIDLRGAGAPAGVMFAELRRDVIASLSSSGVVTATTDANEADASLKIVVSQSGVSVRLVNARGTVLWPTTGRGTRSYSGEPAKVISNIVKDLVAEIRAARR
jgi:hypothetical protein